MGKYILKRIALAFVTIWAVATITFFLMNLVPGIAITNVMRDILGGDLIAGIIKLVESLMVAVGIALGAGLAISTLRYFFPGI